MIAKLITFEWRYFVRQPSFFVLSFLFFIAPFVYMTVNSISKFSGPSVMYNSPHTIATAMLTLGIFSVFLVVNFVADAATRNSSSNMAELIYTKPLPFFQYRLGQFLGAYVVCVTVFAFVPLGLYLGSSMPWVDEGRIGPQILSHYLLPFVYLSLTTLLIVSVVLYSVALRFSSMMAVYVAALGLLVLYLQLGRIFNEPDQREWVALLDPFAFRTYLNVSEYWTAYDRNNQVISLSGDLLINRLFWIGSSIVLLLGIGRLFAPLRLPKNKSSKKDSPSVVLSGAISDKATKNKYQEGSGFTQLRARTILEAKQVILSPGFLTILLFSVAALISMLVSTSSFYGSQDWPVTQNMVSSISASLGFLVIIVVAFYTAEVVWRERNVGVSDMIDSMPVSNKTLWFSKLLSVQLVIVVIYLAGMFCTILFQLIKGQTNIELSQYAIRLSYFSLIPLAISSVLAFFIQALSPNKYMGMFIFIALSALLALGAPQIGIEHHMFNYGSFPSLRYSDLNGYGWSLTSRHWYSVYWGALAVIISIVTYCLWQRGPQMNFNAKVRLLKHTMTYRSKIAIGVMLIVFISSGSFIHYNTRVLNEFATQEDALDARETYERNFSEFESNASPQIVSIDADIALFPKDRRIEAKSNFVVHNKSEEVIDKFLVNLPDFSSVHDVEIEGGKLMPLNDDHFTAWFKFDEPMLPKEKRKGSFNVVREHHGFKDRGEDTALVRNGIFIRNDQLYPSFGVSRSAYISNASERKKRGLPAARRAYLLEDSSRYNETVFGDLDGGQIEFSATVSTSADQTAIVPGYLQRQWVENERNYFRYEMDLTMENYFNISSGIYEVKKEIYKGVEIAIYYHKTHHWNIDRMIESARDSLDHFSAMFGPYQHKQLRIIEFPGYASFAQSFPNTVPYSEAIGFTTDLRDTSKIDAVYYVTAHEIAHQWFGHQLDSANVQGSQVISESLSQYAALTLMEKKYGETKLRKFLTYELREYLSSRSFESVEEMPLLRAENQQYIHYKKGSIVMMAIKDRIGEEAFNAALRKLFEQFRFSTGRLATTLDLVAALKEGKTKEQQAFIDDSFNKITLYDIEIDDASLESDGQQYTVKLNVHARHQTSDGLGDETEEDFDDWVDIVLFSNDPDDFEASNEILYRQKHRLVSGENELSITVAEKPNYVGVDPFVRFIDRKTSDNIRSL
jgi:ABC-2 type transport system permease protein